MSEQQTIDPKKQKPLPAGFLIADRYEIIRPLGAGGMGFVYLAHDRVLGDEQVAIKILHKDFVGDSDLLHRFLREVQLMRRVNHRNVVRTYDVGSENNLVFFTMEYVPGRSLEKIIQDGGCQKKKTASLVIQICEGLQAIHDAGVIHRDLKPGNIIVLDDNTVRITDFGVARPEVSNLTAHNEILGSVCYIAPEIWLADEITPSVDLYSLGIVLYELATGNVPFDGGSAAKVMRLHLDRAPVEPKVHNSSVSPWLNKLILMLLEKSPKNRPESAKAVVDYVKLRTSSSANVELNEAIEPPSQSKSATGVFIAELEEQSKHLTSSIERPEQSRTATSVIAAATKTALPSYAPARSTAHQKIVKKAPAKKKAPNALKTLLIHTTVTLLALLCAVALIYGLELLLLNISPLPPRNAAEVLSSGSLRELEPSSVLLSCALHSIPNLLLLSLPIVGLCIAAGAGRIIFRVFSASLVFLVLATLALTLFHIFPILGQNEISGLSILSAASAAADQLFGIVSLSPQTVEFEKIILSKGLVLGSSSGASATGSYMLASVGLFYLILLAYLLRVIFDEIAPQQSIIHLVIAAILLFLILLEAQFVPATEALRTKELFFSRIPLSWPTLAGLLHWSSIYLVVLLASHNRRNIE